MPRFVFRLEPVLRHRERIEEQKEQQMAVVQRQLLEAEEQQRFLCARRDSVANDLVAGHAKFDGETLRITYAHLDFLAREINAAELRVAACMELVAEARTELVRASQDRKILERLRERKLASYKVEEDRLEQRDLDESNAARHARTMRSGAVPQ